MGKGSVLFVVGAQNSVGAQNAVGAQNSVGAQDFVPLPPKNKFQKIIPRSVGGNHTRFYNHFHF